jgi:hypothetical protein
LLEERLDNKSAHEIAISVWEQLPNPSIRNCVQIGRLVKNEPDIEMAIADEIQNFKEYGALKMSTELLVCIICSLVCSIIILDTSDSGNATQQIMA